MKRDGRPALPRDIASLPPWERGLKQVVHQVHLGEHVSLPPWERGLKHVIEGHGAERGYKSLPPVGAWIETDGVRHLREGKLVAPPVGAWIETS